MDGFTLTCNKCNATAKITQSEYMGGNAFNFESESIKNNSTHSENRFSCECGNEIVEDI